nr:proline-rich protein 36-like [Parasteatoda tepidariorum]
MISSVWRKVLEKTLVIGSSYVALECAEFIARIGLDVTVRSILLRGFDQDMAERIGNYMQEEGIKFLRPCVLASISSPPPSSLPPPPPSTLPPPPLASPPLASPPLASPPLVSPPQASPPQASPPQASPPQASSPQAAPPQAAPPQASPPSASPPSASPPSASPTVQVPPVQAPQVPTPPPVPQQPQARRRRGNPGRRSTRLALLIESSKQFLKTDPPFSLPKRPRYSKKYPA